MLHAVQCTWNDEPQPKRPTDDQATTRHHPRREKGNERCGRAHRRPSLARSRPTGWTPNQSSMSCTANGPCRSWTPSTEAPVDTETWPRPFAPASRTRSSATACADSNSTASSPAMPQTSMPSRTPSPHLASPCTRLSPPSAAGPANTAGSCRHLAADEGSHGLRGVGYPLRPLVAGSEPPCGHTDWRRSGTTTPRRAGSCTSSPDDGPNTRGNPISCSMGRCRQRRHRPPRRPWCFTSPRENPKRQPKASRCMEPGAPRHGSRFPALPNGRTHRISQLVPSGGSCPPVKD